MPRRRVTPAPASASITGLLLAASLAVVPAASADPVDEVQPGEPQRVDRTFSVATLNILGSNHTDGRDFRRTKRTARLIRRQHVRAPGRTTGGGRTVRRLLHLHRGEQ